ncbi:MAG: ATP-dependent helicase [Melioribacteraceae bacterium]|nr:ATP-dependent helicase [Melioribacteraceae bacterium]
MTKSFTLTRTNALPVTVNEANFKIDYENSLNPAQYEAVSALEGVFLVIAGAGSGKTRTLVYRVARLVELGFDPKSILLLTFTRKAAKEMMSRASALLDNRCSKVNGGTFHSFANTTLRRYASYFNLNNNFTILDQGDSEDAINLIRGQLKLAELKKKFPQKQTIFKILSLKINTEKEIEEIVMADYPDYLNYIDKIKEIENLYISYKRKNHLLDYDDLLVFLRDFLKADGPGARSLIESIKFIMVDEYQDTNKLQSDIIKALSKLRENVMVVGDDSQSIYSFRGADFKNIIEFPHLYKDVKLITLEENYRSTQTILDFANQLLENAVEKYPKELFTNKLGGELPVIVKAKDENLQSKFITERVLELREEGIPLSDIAVLFRSSYTTFDLEIELNKAGVNYQKFGGMKFVESAHVKDVIAFLRIASNPLDFVSWYRVLLLHEGVGPKKAQVIIDSVSTGIVSLKSHPEKIKAVYMNDRLYPLFELLHHLHTKNSLTAEKVELVMRYYEPYFEEKFDDHKKRKKDLDTFLNVSEQYKTLDDFLSDLALDPPQNSVVDMEAPPEDREFLTLSTIHSAKGLEWHTVFIMHVLDGVFPSAQSERKLELLEEERRLLYVAVTRAKQNLYISYPEFIYERYRGSDFSKPSRFLSEIKSKFYDEGIILG